MLFDKMDSTNGLSSGKNALKTTIYIALRSNFETKRSQRDISGNLFCHLQECSFSRTILHFIFQGFYQLSMSTVQRGDGHCWPGGARGSRAHRTMKSSWPKCKLPFSFCLSTDGEMLTMVSMYWLVNLCFSRKIHFRSKFKHIHTFSQFR